MSLATEPEVASTHTGAGAELFNTETERRKELNREAVQKNAVLLAAQQSVPLDPSITDEVALGLVLRFVSGNRTEQQKTQVRGYISNVLGITTTADQDQLFRVADTYRLRSNEIQMQAEATIQKYHPTHSTISPQDRQTLRELAQTKNALIVRSAAVLNETLSSAARTALVTNIRERVKSRVKAYRAGEGGH